MPPFMPFSSSLFTNERRCCLFLDRIYEPCFIGVGYIMLSSFIMPPRAPSCPLAHFNTFLLPLTLWLSTTRHSRQSGEGGNGELCATIKICIFSLDPFKMKIFTTQKGGELLSLARPRANIFYYFSGNVCAFYSSKS